MMQERQRFRNLLAIAAAMLFATIPTGLFGQSAGPNPVPFISQPLVPDSVAPGATGVTLTINGTGFVANSSVEAVVLGSGTSMLMTPTYVSNTQLTVTSPALQIPSTPQTWAVMVYNPTPGGGFSNVVYFTVIPPTSSPNFAAGSPIPAGTVPLGVAGGNFNGDSYEDLAVVDNGSNSVTVLLGNGDGTFTPAAGSPITGIGNAREVAVADFNHDGNADLAIQQVGGLETILLGNGDGTFTEATGSPLSAGGYTLAVGDFNGDGNMDVATANGDILLGNGDGTFTAGSPVNVPIDDFGMAVGDLNGDGKLDLIFADTGNNTASVLLGNGDGTFTPAVGSPIAVGVGPTSVAVGDFNGDGTSDLAVCNGGENITILLGIGDGTFTPAASSPATGQGPYSIKTADLNGDGKLDLVNVNNSLNTLTILLGNGDGTFTATPSSPATGSSPYGLAVGDFNGDGMLDLAVANNNDDTVSILLQQPQAPLAELSSTSLLFSGQVINTTSPAKTITLTNSGTAVMTVSDIQTTGDFAQTNDCGTLPAILAPGKLCTLQVSFTPTTIGSASGTVTITDDSSTGTQQQVLLSGTGLSSGVPSPSVPSIDFGSVPVGTTSSAQPVTITNTGAGPLAIISVATTDPHATSLGVASEFSQTNDCGTSLASNASCTVNVTFLPVLLDAETGTLAIMHDGAGSPLVVDLSGTGTAVPFQNGEIFLGVGDGLVQRRSSTGDLIQVLDTTQAFSETTGMAFDSSGNLYSTVFSNQLIAKFNDTGVLQANFVDSVGGNPESILFDASGNAFVGTAAGDTSIKKYDPSGTLLTTFPAATEDRGTDWIDLASDECTMYYTSEGVTVKRYNVCTDTQMPDFAAGLPGFYAYALRVRPNGEVLVADSSVVVRLDASGNIIQTYTGLGAGNLFAVNLDQDGTSFWTADLITTDVYKVDIDSGNVLLHFTTGTSEVAGVAVKGEINVATAPALTLSATSLTMPTTPLNLICAPRTLTLTNTGNGPLTISSIASSDSALFAISSNTCPVAPATLGAGSSCDVGVTFHPETTGTVTGTLTIDSNAVGNPQATVALSGTGEPACPLAAAAASQRVLRGTDRTTFTVQPNATCQATDEIQLACVGANPASCAFNPGTIQNPQQSLLTLRGLNGVTGNTLAFQVTGTSADYIQRTLDLAVNIADFWFTPYPKEATVAAGERATYAMTVVPINGLTGQMRLTCSGAPVGGSCTVVPSTINMANDAPVQVQVRVQTSSGAMVGPVNGWREPETRWLMVLLGLSGLLMALLASKGTAKVRARLGMAIPARTGFFRHPAPYLLLPLLLLMVTWASCGGGGTSVVGRGASATGRYSIVVTGTFTPSAGTSVIYDPSAPPLEHKVNLTLNVR